MARGLWRRLWRSRQIDADMHEEMRFHIDMEAERLVREHGLDPLEARRQAHVRFGGLEKYREAGRDVRGLAWLDAMALDARLGARMLVKHRGLTLVGGFAIAVAIAIGATFVEIVSQVLNPALPFADGDRVVSLQYTGASTANGGRKVLHELVAWRGELKSVEHLSAFRTARHNLAAPNALPEPIKIAEMSASGFAVARVSPLLGRYLVMDDERVGAPPVVVIGYEPWKSRFAGDPQIVGRTIVLGGVLHTVVGVMPEGFKFPVDHDFWMPLRANPAAVERRQGPDLYLFGRLVPGVTLEQAQAELTAVAQRTAAAPPDAAERFQAVVIPYTRERLDLEDPEIVWVLRIGQLLIGALLFVVAVNIAILVYARTVTRLGEIAVRTALGASRRRILVQLFVESLALSGVGAAAGLVFAQITLRRLQELALYNGSVPFWIRLNLSAGTVMYALGLAVLAAAIMGVLPGLKATGRSLNASLRELGARGPRLGRMWTGLVVAQVAAAVAVLPLSVYVAGQMLQMEVSGPGFAAGDFIVSTVAIADDAGPVDSRLFARRQLELMSRLKSEPAVSAVTFSSNVPGFGPGRELELEHDSVERRSPPIASVFDVDVNLFDAYRAQVLAGRVFTAGDLGAARAVVVNRSFAEEFLPDRNPLGARFRYTRAQGQPWYEIVGVVRDFPDFPSALNLDTRPNVYHPLATGARHPIILSVRFDGPVPAGIGDRLRAIGAEVDPSLQLRRVMPLGEFYDQLRVFWRHLALGAGLVTASVLLLSAAGVYALMSFTVAQRTREIGIRAALGAHPRQLVAGIFARAAGQLALGLLAGSLVSGAAMWAAKLDATPAAALLITVAAVMLIVGLAAAAGPARLCLRIEPSEVLRADG